MEKILYSYTAENGRGVENGTGENIPCWICGAPAAKYTNWITRDDETLKTYNPPPTRSKRCYCEKCFDSECIRKKSEGEEYNRLRKSRMLDKAIRVLERLNDDMYNYKHSIEVVEKYMRSNPKKFDSSYEILAAIVLFQNKIKIIPQQNIGRYVVDFVLPEKKVILEIDGDRHKYSKERDEERDEYLYLALGKDWNIVRISTYLLEKHPERIPESIDKVIEKRNTCKNRV